MFIIGGRDPIFRGHAFASFLSGGAGGAGPGPVRTVIDRAEGVGFSAHSFLAFAAAVTGDGGSPVFDAIWGGPIRLNYLGFSSLKDRWDANGLDRTGTYAGALWLTEFTNPAEGWPAYDSARGIETLQYLFWYGLTAQAKGCKAIFIYPPWSPEGMAALDPTTMQHAQFWRDWLDARPEITIPVYLMPVPVIVGRFRDYFAPQSIYSDGLHLRGPNDAAPNQSMGAMGVGLDMMMTGQRIPNDAGWNADMIAQVGIVWDTIQEYACTGFGGPVVVTPIGSTDPLPSPAPLP